MKIDKNYPRSSQVPIFYLFQCFIEKLFPDPGQFFDKAELWSSPNEMSITISTNQKDLKFCQPLDISMI